jgi:ketosteroid isomerase-like protein
LATPAEILDDYLKTIATFPSADVLGNFFAPDVVHEELPNRLFPEGRRNDLAALLAASQRGPEILASQSYHLRRAIVSGDEVAAELEWTGTLRRGFGNVPAGASLRAAVAQFLSFRDGKIRSLRNYDCYYPF